MSPRRRALFFLCGYDKHVGPDGPVMVPVRKHAVENQISVNWCGLVVKKSGLFSAGFRLSGVQAIVSLCDLEFLGATQMHLVSQVSFRVKLCSFAVGLRGLTPFPLS